jgi:hypothetical protein
VKKLLVLLAVIPFVAQAERVVSDPYPAGTVIDKFQLSVNGGTYTDCAPKVTGGLISVDCNVGTLSPTATYTFNVKAVNSRGESPPGNFTVPALPTAPSNTRLVP